MHKKFISAFKTLNLLFQALYTLLFPVGIATLASFLLTKYASCPKWIWAVLITLGMFSGLYSMIKYLLSTIKSYERAEQASEAAKARQEAKEEMHQRMRDLANKEKNEEESNG